MQGDALLAFAPGGELIDGRLFGLTAIVRDGMDAEAFVVELDGREPFGLFSAEQPMRQAAHQGALRWIHEAVPPG